MLGLLLPTCEMGWSSWHLASGFSLTQFWLLQVFGESINRWVASLTVCLSLSLTVTLPLR